MRSAERPIIAIDLFCGVGGLTYGLARGGITVKAGVDLDPACRYPYESNNSAKFIESDVKDLAPSDLKKYLVGDGLKLLAGCAPCQSFSSYSRGGRSRKRELDWQLVTAFGQLVADMQPDLVTMENVPQLEAHPVLQQFLGYLRGYEIRYTVVDCADLGVPQSRRRLVLLASRLGSEGLDFPASPATMRTVRDTIAHLPPLVAGQRDLEDPLHAASSLSAMNMTRIRASSPGGTWRDWDASLRATCHKKASGTTYPSVYGRMEWDRIAPTITTQCFGYGNGRFGHPEQHRAISLREAAMLQTFPRSYAFIAPDEPIRFNKLGRLIGNAVPVRLGEVIAEILVRHVELSAGS